MTICPLFSFLRSYFNVWGLFCIIWGYFCIFLGEKPWEIFVFFGAKKAGQFCIFLGGFLVLVSAFLI
jgi:hypothetical protein